MQILGIDPGYTGAIACLNTVTNELVVMDMPVAKNPKGKTTLDMPSLFGLFQGAPRKNVLAVVEKVSAMPGQGVSSVFRFGEGFGALQMAIVARELPMQVCHPLPSGRSISD